MAAGFSFPLQNWHRAATYIAEMLSRTKLFEYWICLSSEPWLDPPHTVEVADKLAVSLVEFSYSVLYNTSKLQAEESATSISLDIKRRSIDLRVEIS